MVVGRPTWASIRGFAGHIFRCLSKARRFNQQHDRSTIVNRKLIRPQHLRSSVWGASVWLRHASELTNRQCGLRAHPKEPHIVARWYG